MTDKERIIVDTNKYFVEVVDESGGTIGYYVVHPERLLREIIKQNKQLTDKTQECEELKEQLQANQPTGICETCMATTLFQNDKYRKALKTIKEICLNNVYIFAYGTRIRYDLIDNILDIINKLKEEL